MECLIPRRHKSLNGAKEIFKKKKKSVEKLGKLEDNAFVVQLQHWKPM